jgi:outer membrane protein assembly factor BamB
VVARVLALTALAIALPIAGAITIAAQDWPQILGPTRNGVYAGPPIATAFPRGGPPLLWKRDVGQGFAGPSVAGGRLILFHRVRERETVEALDAVTGKTIWTFEYPTAYRDDFGFDEGPRAVPVIAGRRVFTFGADGMLHGLAFATGEKLWSVDTPREFSVAKGYFGAASSPVVDGEHVLLNVGGKTAGIVAFDAATGKPLWTATADEASYSAPVVAEIGGTRTAVFFTRAGLVALDPVTGAVQYQFRWRARQAASVNAATPLVINDRIFLSASYGTGAVLLQVANGALKPLWSGDESLSNHYSTSVYRDGYLYGFEGRQEFGQSLRCIELATGRVMWSVDGFGAGTLLIAGDTLVITRESGELVLVPASAKSFQPSSRAQLLPGIVRAYPAMAAGRFYLRNERTLAAFDLRATP